MVTTIKKNTTNLYRRLLSSPMTVGLLALPIIVFFIYFFTYRYNIPWFDDFENIPFFLDRFLNTPSFSEKISALIRPNNEHRVVYARLIALIEYFLTGGLNFGHLMFLGNMALVVIFSLIYFALRRWEGSTQRTLVGMLPVSLLLFSPQMYLMTFTAVFTLQYLSIIMLAMLTFFVLATDRPLNLGIAAVIGILSTFSMGNGLLVWPAGAGMLLIQRRWTALGIWLLLGGLSGYLYFYGYPVQQGNANGFVYVLEHPLQTMAGFVILVGNAFDVFPNLSINYRVYPPFFAGLILVGGIGYWLIKTLLKKERNTSFAETFIFGSILFLIGTFALFALFRIRFNFEMVVHISYRIYALTLCSLACILLFRYLSERKRERVWPAFLGGMLATSVFMYYMYLPLATERRLHMQGLVFNQLHDDVGLGGDRNSYLATYIANLLKMMKDRGWYTLPDPAISLDERTLLESASKPVSGKQVEIEMQSDYVIVSNRDSDYRVGFGKGTYVILKSAQHTYVMFAGRKRPVGFKPWLIEPGFWTAIPIQMIQPGRYQLGLFHVVDGKGNREYLNQFVDIN